MVKQLVVEVRSERPGAGERPQGLEPMFAVELLVEHEGFELRSGGGRGAFGKEPLGEVAIENVGAAKPFDQLLVGFPSEIELGRAGRAFVADAVEASLQAVDALRIAIGVLIAVVAVVPVEDIQAAVGARLLHHWHEPRIVGGQEIGMACAAVGRTFAAHRVDIDAAAVDIAHIQLVAVRGRIGDAIKVVDPAVGRLLMLMGNDRVDFPGEGRIGAALAMVVA